MENSGSPDRANAAIAALDAAQFARFFITGIVATMGNVSMVWATRHFLAYHFALAAGLATGFTISFLMGKFFAFRSGSWREAPGEAMRFLLVYGFGASLYWGISMIMGLAVLPLLMPAEYAETLGSLVGASVMIVTSYLGHRFYTYRGASGPIG